MSLPDDLLARLWGALTLDGNGNVGIRTVAAVLGAASVHTTNVDWGTGAAQVYALRMPIADAGNYFPGNLNVEGALQVLGAAVAVSGAPANAKYIIQVANGTLTNAQVLGSLATGIVKNTTTTGVLSIAAQGTDYYAPGGTKVALADGGTNAAVTASLGGIAYSTTTALAVLAGTATARQMLQSGASLAPAWSSTTWPATTTAKQILYSSGTNVVGEITTGNSGVLVTDGSGNPSISTDLPTAVTIGGAYNYRAGGTKVALADGGTNAGLTAANGAIPYSTSTAFALLAPTATAGQHLQSGSNAAPSWTTATFPATATSTGTILRADGTNWVATTATYPNTVAVSTILYGSSTNVVGTLATANSAILNTGATGIPALTATPIIGTSLQVGIASTSTGSIKLAHASSANVVTIQAGNFSAGTTYTWPTADGSSGQGLSTNASGVLSWATFTSKDYIQVLQQTTNPAYTTDDILSTIAETAFATQWAGAANVFGTAGDSLRIRAFGSCRVTGTPTFTLQIRYGGIGGTSLFTTGALTAASSAANRDWFLDCTITCDSVGATGKVSVITNYYTNLTSAVTDLWIFSQPEAADNDNRFTIDTTTQNAIVVTAKFSASSASNIASLTHLSVTPIYATAK